MKVLPNLAAVREKLEMYQSPFIPVREADYFQQRGSASSILESLKSDLPRFLPQNIIALYQKNDFNEFFSVLKEVTSDLLAQGIEEYFKNHDGRKSNP